MFYVSLSTTAGGADVPFFKALLDMRSDTNEKGYFYFFDNFLECVSGKRGWGKVKAVHLVSDYCSISDEAFTLLALENNWRRWSSKEKRGKGVYTASMQGNKMFEGWSEEGLQRYNELYRLVKENRESEEGKKFERAFREKKQAELKNKVLRKSPVPKKAIVVMDDLSDESDWDVAQEEVVEEDEDDGGNLWDDDELDKNVRGKNRSNDENVDEESTSSEESMG